MIMANIQQCLLSVRLSSQSIIHYIISFNPHRNLVLHVEKPRYREAKGLICMHICVCLCMYVCTYVYLYMWVYMCAHMTQIQVFGHQSLSDADF